MAYRQTTNPLSRNSSSPLNAHDEAKVAELTKKIEARVKELNPTGDPQSRVFEAGTIHIRGRSHPHSPSWSTLGSGRSAFD